MRASFPVALLSGAFFSSLFSSLASINDGKLSVPLSTYLNSFSPPRPMIRNQAYSGQNNSHLFQFVTIYITALLKMVRAIFKDLVIASAGSFPDGITIERAKSWTEMRKGLFVSDMDDSVTHLLCTDEEFKAKKRINRST